MIWMFQVCYAGRNKRRDAEGSFHTEKRLEIPFPILHGANAAKNKRLRSLQLQLSHDIVESFKIKTFHNTQSLPLRNRARNFNSGTNKRRHISTCSGVTLSPKRFHET